MIPIDFQKTPPILTSYVLEREGCPIHYWFGGPADRPLVVLMHGATMDHRMFNPQVEALAPEYRLLVWDARGHGESQPIGTGFSLAMCACDLLAILDKAGVNEAVIGGQSLGGLIAQHVYMQAPQRVRAMIAIGATPLARPYNKWEVSALKASLPIMRYWPFGHLTETIARRTALTEPGRAYAREAINRTSRDNFLTIWRDVSLAVDERGRPDLRIEVPLLLLHGDRDTTGTIRRDMPEWAAMDPDTEYHVIPHAAHNANQDNPIETNRLILDFLRRRVG